MSKKKLVIVESPTKARTIRKFLGKGYEVESCMGHLRDLPESSKDIPEKYKKYKWARLGVNVDKNFEPIYCIPKSKSKVASLLKKKASSAGEVILATDEDREGESISWHLQHILKSKNLKFKRMVFHEITKEAIVSALKNCRKVDKNLVYAQEARRILDRLVGYTLSPVLWKSVARGLSAGRVQSVAVKLLSERELKRMNFKSSPYWSLQAFFKKNKSEFSAQMISYKDKTIATGSDFDRNTGEFSKKKNLLLLDEKKSKELKKELKNLSFKVLNVKTQDISRKPQAPFTTSTLQQESNRKLFLSAKETMTLAQTLYERGFITYMRTDAVFLSHQAVKAARFSIQKNYGKKYLPEKARIYKNKSKGAQEAHEAIRPAGNTFIHPKDSGLSGYLFKLYQIIWQRTLASQAVDCKQKRVSGRISAGSKAVFSFSGTSTVFEGFLRIYSVEKEEKDSLLPPLKTGDALKCSEIKTQGHETRPPSRFNEASLVQTLEQEGIGRPSTYAPIISTIQKRGYVFKDKNVLAPTMTALIVTKFLNEYFSDYVNTRFTSDMEQSLDDIAMGGKDHVQYLNRFYFGKNGLKKQVENYKESEDSRSMVFEKFKGFVFFAGPYGAYVMQEKKNKKEKISASLPLNLHPGDLTQNSLNSLIESKLKGNDSLGEDSKTGEPIYFLTGKYGPYVQRGNVNKDSKEKPKRVSVPRGLSEENVDLETALRLLELPKTLGVHPETSKDVKKGIGRFGPYIVHDGDFRSIRSVEEFFGLNLKKALQVLSEPKKGRSKKALKNLGAHPDTGENVLILDGKYGPYLQHKSQRVSLPKEIAVSALTLKEALALLGSSVFKKGKPSSSNSRNGKTLNVPQGKSKFQERKPSLAKNSRQKTSLRRAAAVSVSRGKRQGTKIKKEGYAH